MKKVLSIVLAVVMAFSALGVGSFAMTVEELPIFPEQTEGRIYFAADTTWIEVGEGTYEVPVYLVSDYSVDYDVKFVELGFCVGITSSDVDLNDGDYAEILDVKASDELKAMPGYANIETGYGLTDNIIDEGIGYCSFKVDGDAIFKQAKLPVAVVTVAISENFPGGANAPVLMLMGYDFSYAPAGAFYGMGGIFDENVDFDSAPTDPLEDDYRLEPTTEIILGEGSDGDLFFSFGYMMEKPAKVYKWKDNLVNWLDGIIDQIFAIGEEIHDFIDTIIGAIRAALHLDPPAEPAPVEPVE